MNTIIKALCVVFGFITIPFLVYLSLYAEKKFDCNNLKKAASRDSTLEYVTVWYAQFSDKLINSPLSYSFLTGSAQTSSLVSPERFEHLEFDLSVVGFESEVESKISFNRDISLWGEDFEIRDVESISLMSSVGWVIFDVAQPGNLGTIFWRDITEDLDRINDTLFIYCEADN